MPIPKPNKGESKDEFVSRCMGNSAMQEYDQDQRSAICYQSWKDKNKPRGNEMIPITANIDLSHVKGVELDGVNYLAAPVVMAVETVMNNIFYPNDELAKYTSAWDGRPVTLFHPKDTEGQFISANSPSVDRTIHLGQIFNTTFDNGLKAEVWLNLDKAKATRPDLLDYFNGQKGNLEVSTGLWGDILRVPGTYNGKDYVGIMTNIRPDHLALLPGGEGACSWSDGCGLRSNEMFKITAENQDSVYQVLKAYGYRANAEVMTDYETAEVVRKAVDELDTPQLIHYMEDLISSKKQVIYRKSKRSTGADMPSTIGDKGMFRQSYEIDENGRATLTGEPEEVRRKITYVPVKEEVNVMNTEEKKSKVDALIACQRCKYQEKDREFLMALNEEQLELITPPDNVVIKPEPVAATPVTPTQDKEPHGNVAVNAVDWLEQQTEMPKEVRETLAESLVQNQVIRTDLITKIMASKGNLFTAEALAAETTSKLKGIVALVDNARETPAATPEDPQSFFGMRLSGNASIGDTKGPEPMITQSLEEVFKANHKK